MATHPTTWSNWSGDAVSAASAIWRPKDEAELAGLIRDANGPIRPAGSGHSFTPLCASDGVIVSLEHLSGLIAADTGRQEAEFWAGTPIYEVGPLLHPHGLALPNQGDIDRQTLAGAISTGTHGTGRDFGALSTMVVGVTLVTGSGEILTVDINNEKEIFEFARLSLGSAGIITRLRLKLEPSFALSEKSYVAEAGKVLGKLDDLALKHRHFEFFWFPYADQVVVKTLDLWDGPEPETTLDAGTMKRRGERRTRDDKLFELICRIVKLVPVASGFFHRFLTRQMASSETRPGRGRWSWETFPSARTTRFREMEYAFPAGQAAEVLQALVARIRKDRIATAFPIEVRMVKADDIWLSPFNGRDSVTFSVHQYLGMDHTKLFRVCEEVFRAFDGRPHWGKLHNLSGRDFAWTYPDWRRAQAVRRRLDPQGKFLTPYLRDLFETGIASEIDAD